MSDEILQSTDGWLERRDELRERFAERIDDPSVDAAVGMSLIGAGLGTIAVSLFRGKRSVWAYLVSAVLVLAGIAVISGGAVSRRSDRIANAEEAVRADLSGLDPIARAQVLRGVASETFAPFIRHLSN